MTKETKVDPEASKEKEGGGEGRAEWGGQIEFILTCVGYAVGLGNIWRFPYLCYKNGGGAFLIPYFGTLALVGLPLFFLELSFGQFASLGPIAIWSVNPFFKGLGYAMVITNTTVTLYYNVIIAWALYYFFASMASKVPWLDCDNSWNTPYCATSAQMRNLTGNATWMIGNDSIAKTELKSPTEEYFYNKVLQMSGGIDEPGTIVWQLALCLFLAWLIVFVVLIRGISSLGKVVYFTSIFPYVLLTVMLVRGVTLEGAKEGIIFYLKPDFNRLKDARVWSDAATQIFFSLSTCTGGLIAMASYNKFNNNCKRDAIMVPIINCATSFYGGFAIFSVLGYMAAQKGVSVADVAASGPGLVFVVYPEGLSTMSAAPLWSILFFLMMMTLGLSSMFSMVECFFCALMDEFPNLLRKTRRRTIIFRVVGCTIFYLIGLSMVTNGGFYLFSIIDSALSGFPLLFVGLLESLALMYVYGYNKFADDVKMMLGVKPGIYFRVCWCVLAPVILLATAIFMAAQYTPITLFSGKYVFPAWADAITWLIVFLCLVFIPVFAIRNFCRNGGYEVLKVTNTPMSNWGPALDEHRTGKYEKFGVNKTNIPLSFPMNPEFPGSQGSEIQTNGLYNGSQNGLTNGLTNGHTTDGHTTDGHTTDGHITDGHTNLVFVGDEPGQLTGNEKTVANFVDTEKF